MPTYSTIFWLTPNFTKTYCTCHRLGRFGSKKNRVTATSKRFVFPKESCQSAFHPHHWSTDGRVDLLGRARWLSRSFFYCMCLVYVFPVLPPNEIAEKTFIDQAINQHKYTQVDLTYGSSFPKCWLGLSVFNRWRVLILCSSMLVSFSCSEDVWSVILVLPSQAKHQTVGKIPKSQKRSNNKSVVGTSLQQ